MNPHPQAGGTAPLSLLRRRPGAWQHRQDHDPAERRIRPARPVLILGLGIDVVDVARFGQTLDRTPRLRARLFTEAEQRLPLASLAARFAAKEAAAKALGAPVGLRWTDAEVHVEHGGRPRLEVHGSVAARAEELGVRRWHVSLSHDAGIASAVVIAEGEAG